MERDYSEFSMGTYFKAGLAGVAGGVSEAGVVEMREVGNEPLPVTVAPFRYEPIEDEL